MRAINFDRDYTQKDIEERQDMYRRWYREKNEIKDHYEDYDTDIGSPNYKKHNIVTIKVEKKISNYNFMKYIFEGLLYFLEDIEDIIDTTNKKITKNKSKLKKKYDKNIIDKATLDNKLKELDEYTEEQKRIFVPLYAEITNILDYFVKTILDNEFRKDFSEYKNIDYNYNLNYLDSIYNKNYEKCVLDILQFYANIYKKHRDKILNIFNKVIELVNDYKDFQGSYILSKFIVEYIDDVHSRIVDDKFTNLFSKKRKRKHTRKHK